MVSLPETEDHPSVLWLWYMSTFRGLVCLSTLSSTILLSSETGTIASIQSVSPQQKKNHSCKPRTWETLLLWQIVRRGVSGIMPRFCPPNVCTIWQQWRAKGNPYESSNRSGVQRRNPFLPDASFLVVVELWYDASSVDVDWHGCVRPLQFCFWIVPGITLSSPPAFSSYRVL